MPLDPVTELEGLISAFEAAGVGYAVCGGLALAVHGYPRATMDIDLLVRAEEIASAMAVAKLAGFDIPAKKMTFGLRTGTPREIQRVSKLDPETGALLALDLIVVNAELEQVWATRTTLQADERRMTVVSREGLATMKRIAGRPQDLVDLAKLEGTNDDDPG
jgi:hypothetical protein